MWVTPTLGLCEVLGLGGLQLRAGALLLQLGLRAVGSVVNLQKIMVVREGFGQQLSQQSAPWPVHDMLG